MMIEITLRAPMPKQSRQNLLNRHTLAVVLLEEYHIALLG